MHKVLPLVALLIVPNVGLADLADEDPESLCSLLSSFGLAMTKFEAFSEFDDDRPLCLTRSQPNSFDSDGYEFSYRVIAHFEREHAQSLFLRLEGIASKVLGQEPQSRFADMSKVILSRLVTDKVVSNTVLAIQSLAPGFNRHMTVQGYNIHLLSNSGTPPGYPEVVSMRLDIGNMCEYAPAEIEGKSRCLTKYDAPRGSLLADGDESN